MSLTKRQKDELVRIFRLIPRRVRAQKQEQHSYFTIDEREFSFTLDLTTQKDIIKSLESVWENTKFKPIAREIIRIVPLFKNVQESDSVSPFVYEMF